MRSLFNAIYYWANVFTWIRLVTWINTRREVIGLKHVPRKGPVILASNHLSEADPAIIMTLMPRRIVWMAKRELFDLPVLGIFYHFYGAIPVRRFEADLPALRKAEEALRKGQVLGMFPEGTRSRDCRLGHGEPGTALMALRSGALILPIGISGTEVMRLPRAFFQRTPVRVAFGEPFYLPQVERIRTPIVEECSELIMGKIAALLPPRYRGEYAAAVATEASPQEVGQA